MRHGTIALSLIAFLAMTVFCEAKGLVKVQQADGSIQLYPDSTFHVVGKTLKITTANNKGTLIVTEAACTMADKLLRCLPYAVLLKQNGDFPIAITGGTIYYNSGKEKRSLRYTSMQIQPNGVLGVMKSRHGTYVTLSGELDGRAQR